jgi:hypothetical protein
MRYLEDGMRFWQFGGLAFVAGLIVGAIAGPSFFPIALAVTIIVVSGGACRFAVAIRAASLTGDEAERYVYEARGVNW